MLSRLPHRCVCMCVCVHVRMQNVRPTIEQMNKSNEQILITIVFKFVLWRGGEGPERNNGARATLRSDVDGYNDLMPIIQYIRLRVF